MTRILWLGLLLVLGCTKPTPIAEPKVVPPYKADLAALPPTPAASPAKATDANDFARQFLAAVNAGTATPGQLTPEFKRIIAEPAAGDDIATGYSDDRAGRFLMKHKAAVPVPAVVVASESGGVFVLLGTSPAPLQTAVRLVKGPAGWLVDWFSAISVASVSPRPAGPVGFAACAFLDALLGHDDRLAEGLLSPAYKAGLAPPFSSDQRGYNRGTLEAKLGSWRGGFTGYGVVKVEGNAATGELTKGTAKKPFMLKLAAGSRPGELLVESLAVE